MPHWHHPTRSCTQGKFRRRSSQQIILLTLLNLIWRYWEPFRQLDTACQTPRSDLGRESRSSGYTLYVIKDWFRLLALSFSVIKRILPAHRHHLTPLQHERKPSYLSDKLVLLSPGSERKRNMAVVSNLLPHAGTWEHFATRELGLISYYSLICTILIKNFRSRRVKEVQNSSC